MKKFFALLVLFCSFFTVNCFAGDTASQTINISIKPFASISFKNSSDNQAHLIIEENGAVSCEQKELGLTTTLSGLSICAQVVEQPQNPSFKIGVAVSNIDFKGIVGNSLGWTAIDEASPTKLVRDIGPGYGFYSIEYKAESTKPTEEVEYYTISFTVADDN